VLREVADVSRVVGEALRSLERLALTVAGEVGDENAVPAGEERSEKSEVDGGPAQAVHEDERRPLASHEIASANTADLCGSRFEPSKERCLRHGRSIFCPYGLGRSAEPLSSVADMEVA
jgi:hypothetical protein